MTTGRPRPGGGWKPVVASVLAAANVGLVGANLIRYDVVSVGGDAATTAEDELAGDDPGPSADGATTDPDSATTSSTLAIELETIDETPAEPAVEAEGPLAPRRILLDPAGSAVVTGSSPSDDVSARVVELVAANLGVELSAVDDQLLLHPDAAPEIRAGQVLIEQAAVLDLDGDTIRADSFPALDFAADLLLSRPSLFAVVIGHTDDVGDAQVNAQLAADRAQVVADYLVDAGVAPGQLVVAAAGEDALMASNDTLEGREFNRRIEVQFKNFLVTPGSVG